MWLLTHSTYPVTYSKVESLRCNWQKKDICRQLCNE
jgi:hypothetical protein